MGFGGERGWGNRIIIFILIARKSFVDVVDVAEGGVLVEVYFQSS